MNQPILFSLQVYGIAIVIAMLVAVLIKFMVFVTGRLERSTAAKTVPQGEVCPVAQGIPDEDVVALSAAIFAAIGAHHILHISPTSRTWSSNGRAAQHTSHAVFQRPQH
jgi:Na+-transporting methylmalonyl-CoA/oxaloacetate decarboxylase gamma subunit